MFNVEGKIFRGKLKNYQDQTVNEKIYFTIIKENGQIIAREIGNNYGYSLETVYHTNREKQGKDIYYIEALFSVIDYDGKLLSPSKIVTLCQASEKEIDDYLEVISIINEVKEKTKDIERPIYKSYIKR